MRYFVLLSTFLAASCVYSYTECDRKLSECKLITECFTIPFLKNLNKTNQQFNYLRESICGFQKNYPKICCPLASLVSHDGPPTVEPVTTTPVVDSTTPGGMAGDCPASYLPPNPDSKCCGTHGFSSKVIGGFETGFDQYPWLALLEYRDRYINVIDTKCGGSLISGRYVLTAAQCVDAIRTILPESVRLGEYDTLTDVDCVEDDDIKTCYNVSISIPIQEIMTHNLFKRGRHPKNDIALVRLTQLVTFNDYIKPVCLPSTNGPTPSNLYVAGWGATSTGKRSSIKMHVMLPSVNLTNCNLYYHQLEQSQICAGGEIGRDACKGDSGGPLMRYIGSRYEVLGIVSYGSKPCGYHIPGVYTNVMEYLDWIKDNMHE
ncbi:hypothetical protein MSG28_012624 [Choristoneura fumiferana]|uniref:Uncharacterized protein n=1 Tax=Choristoneura fumiferana TaxID=7141 RepID=A0ACC0JHE4_CHOFU|nr:hypothetical protein MSG28_012624 [Choristoneura fumiferana]